MLRCASLHGAHEIFTAIREGAIDQVHTLVERNPKLVNAKDKDDQTSLHDAAYQGHEQIVKYLLKHSADVNAVNTDGQAPIDVANKKGFTSIVELLAAAKSKENGTQKLSNLDYNLRELASLHMQQ